MLYHARRYIADRLSNGLVLGLLVASGTFYVLSRLADVASL